MDADLLCDYEFQSTIGEGGFSKVYRAIHRPTGTRVAIKVMPKKRANDKHKELNGRNEVETLRIAQHPFICRFYEALESEDNIYLVMECLDNGTLLNEVTKNTKLEERDAAIIFSEFMLALRHLHKNCHIAHRDIKLENILLDDNHNIRLIDFGFSKSVEGTFLKTHCGSCLYAAPELLMGEEYSEKVDIWSAGVMLYVMTTGNFPFYHENVSVCLQKIVMSEVQLPSFLSFGLKDLLMRMLSKSPEERPSVDQILDHPWMRSYRIDIEQMLDGVVIENEYLENEIAKYKGRNVNRELLVNIIKAQVYTIRMKSIFYMTQSKPMNSRSLPQLRPLERVPMEKVTLDRNCSGRNHPPIINKLHMSSPIRLRSNKKAMFTTNSL